MSPLRFEIAYQEGCGQVDKHGDEPLAQWFEGRASGLDPVGDFQVGGPLIVKRSGTFVVAWVRASRVIRNEAWEAWGFKEVGDAEAANWVSHWGLFEAGAIHEIDLTKQGENWPDVPATLSSELARVYFGYTNRREWTISLHDKSDIALLGWIWLLGPIGDGAASLAPPRRKTADNYTYQGHIHGPRSEEQPDGHYLGECDEIVRLLKEKQYDKAISAAKRLRIAAAKTRPPKALIQPQPPAPVTVPEPAVVPPAEAQRPPSTPAPPQREKGSDTTANFDGSPTRSGRSWGQWLEPGGDLPRVWRGVLVSNLLQLATIILLLAVLWRTTYPPPAQPSQIVPGQASNSQRGGGSADGPPLQPKTDDDSIKWCGGKFNSVDDQVRMSKRLHDRISRLAPAGDVIPFLDGLSLAKELWTRPEERRVVALVIQMYLRSECQSTSMIDGYLGEMTRQAIDDCRATKTDAPGPDITALAWLCKLGGDTR